MTRQVRTKTALVAHRTGFDQEHPTHFGTASPKSVWEKMYAHRSAIAHGKPASFTGDQQALKSHYNALAFLVKATTCVLRMALTDGACLATSRSAERASDPLVIARRLREAKDRNIGGKFLRSVGNPKEALHWQVMPVMS